MEGYLGEEVLDSHQNTPYEKYTQLDWAMEYIETYGQIDGGHHKAWVLDQVAQILKGTPVILSLAKWSNGHSEYRFKTGQLSEEYKQWANYMLGENQQEYEYYIGVAP